MAVLYAGICELYHSVYVRLFVCLSVLNRSCWWCAKNERMENSSRRIFCDICIAVSCWCLSFLPVSECV